MTIGGATRVFGLIGDPVHHSLSPALMNDAFARLGLDAVYVAWRVPLDRVGTALDGLAALGIAGVNVTFPAKGAVLPHLVGYSDAVSVLAAANVLVPAAGGFHGENTDAGGTTLALRELLDWPAAGRRVVILGAGGAGRAAALGLLRDGAATVTFLVRHPDRAEVAVAGLRSVAAEGSLVVAALDDPDARAALEAAELVVQATTVGLEDASAPPLVTPAAAPAAAAFELNYGPRPTAFATAWREAGRPCLGGRDLLAAQAHLALRCWLDQAPDLVDMRRVIATKEDA
jgi:shikimate dehydrogenase